MVRSTLLTSIRCNGSPNTTLVHICVRLLSPERMYVSQVMFSEAVTYAAQVNISSTRIPLTNWSQPIFLEK